MTIRYMQYVLLAFKFLCYFLMVACSQGDRFEMKRSSTKPLSDAIARGKVLEQCNSNLADLARAVCNDRIKRVKDLLQDNPPLALEPIDALGTTVLGLAVAKGRKEIMDYLLDNYSGHNFNQVCDKAGNSLLIMPILQDYTEIVKRLVEKTASGLDVNQSNKGGHTPLSIAIKRNKLEIVKLLLASKATIKIEHFFICCEKNHIAMASLLLNHLENKTEMINQQYGGLSILHFAITLGKTEFTAFLITEFRQFLIKAGAALACKALTLAADYGHHAIVQRLLEAGVNPNITTDAQDKTPLMIASGKGHTEIVATLIENKQTDVAKINKYDRNALYFAIRFWKPDIINLLLGVKDVDLFQGLYSMLFIGLFIRYYDPKTSVDDRLLIQKICGKCTRPEPIIDDLVLELMKEEDRFVQLLEFYILQQEVPAAPIKLASILASIKPKGKPLLSYAVQHGYKQIVTKLCDHLLNKADEKDTSGRTPLAYAVANGSFIMFKDLLKKGADFKVKDWSGRSILSYALEGLNNSHDHIGSQCIVQKLLDHDGHNVNAAELTNIEYIQLLDFVLQNKKKVPWMAKLHIFDRCINQIKDHTQILTILNKLSVADDKAYLQQKDRAGRTLLSHFAQTGALELVRELVAQSTAMHMNQADDMGKTPLFYALQADQVDSIKILLEKGADVHHKDDQSYTPLLYAIQHKCSIDVIKMLLQHKADLSYCNRQNQGPLSYAIDRDYLSVVDVLLPKMIEEPKCHTDLFEALSLAQKEQGTALYNKLVNAIAPLCEEDDGQGWIEQRLTTWESTTVSYSMHAKQRAKERNIELNAIAQVIRKPCVSQQSKQSDHILKLMGNNICVVIAKQEKKINVITTYKINENMHKA